MSFDISFIIATLNREDELIKLFKSLNKIKTNINFEVVVVDQGNSSFIKDFCSKNKFKYIFSSIKGLSNARNIGIEIAKGKYISLMDDDALFPLDFFVQFEKVYKKNLDVFSGRIMTIEDENIPFSRHQIDKISNVSVRNIDYILSTSLFFKKKVFHIVGKFDTNFGVGAYYGASEETDYALRILKNDFTIKYFPFLIILHPKANNKNIKFNEVLKKSWSYSLGRGALIRKHNHLNLYFKLKNLILMPILKFFYGLFRLNPKDAISGLVSLASRITGFIKYDK